LNAKIGVIGGSGLYHMPGFEAHEEMEIATPWGSPSEKFVVGTLAGKTVAFLARHGRGHRISPSELNFRANIWAMKSLGVERIISLSAVGSLKEEHKPLDFVIPDQFFDRTRGRVSTFFGEGMVAHISFADPVCSQVMEVANQSCQAVGVTVKKGGAYLCMEGPAFSTKAESNVYRSWGMDVIGMTNLQEAKLAREAEICYATIAMVTDYDCWHKDHDAVTVNDIIANLTKKRRERRESGGHGGCTHAGSARMQVRRRARPCHHYGSQGGPRRHTKETGSPDWQVFRLKKPPMNCSATACAASSGRVSYCSV
jgi:5'-methylthioadenosine phosphorylase